MKAQVMNRKKIHIYKRTIPAFGNLVRSRFCHYCRWGRHRFFTLKRNCPFLGGKKKGGISPRTTNFDGRPNIKRTLSRRATKLLCKSIKEDPPGPKKGRAALTTFIVWAGSLPSNLMPLMNPSSRLVSHAASRR